MVWIFIIYVCYRVFKAFLTLFDITIFDVYFVHINWMLRTVKCCHFNLSAIKTYNCFTHLFTLYTKQIYFFYLHYNRFFDILLIFICLNLTYFYINFLHPLFVYLFPRQIVLYIYFAFVLTIFFCCFHNILLIVLYHLVDDNNLVLVFAILFVILRIITYFIRKKFLKHII